eukprot:545710_1
MSKKEKNKSIIDYSKWDNVVVDDDYHIDVNTAFNAQIPSINTTNITAEEAERVKIPRSPRPLPTEPPVLADGLLEPPPFNAPKGAAAVRHYQIGFGHNIINKNKNKSKHNRASSMTVFEQMQDLINKETQDKTDKKYGIKIDDDNTELLKECGELLEFMMTETAKEQKQDNNNDNNNRSSTDFNASHHDYYKHNPHEYYRHKAMKTHNNSSINEDMSEIPKIDVIVKMGGAFITNKTKLHTLNENNIDIAAKHILDAYKSNYIMILVHGAGSYGHFEAKKYKLMNGLYKSDSIKGMVLCRKTVNILHQFLVNKLIEYELPIISVSPNNIIQSNDGIISRKQFKPFIAHINRIIKYGMIPLIHGDIIFDNKRGCHILSGDIIIQHLSSIFNPQRTVFWSNINGIYDCTNINKKYKLLKRINVNPKGIPLLNENIIKQLKNPNKFFKKQQDKYMEMLSKKFDEKLKNKNEKKMDDINDNEIKKDNMINIDATGGMWQKIQVAAKCCAQGIDVIIAKGGTDEAKLALLGKYVDNATVFVPSDTLV